jgi:large subunit ribosomal protein L18
MNNILKRNKLRQKRTLRVRRHLRGNATKPRMCVVKSNLHIEVQLIDDEKGYTLASVNTRMKEFKSTEFVKKNKATAAKLGEIIAAKAKEKQISTVIFDRGPFKYHGVLAALADAAREHGLKF